MKRLEAPPTAPFATPSASSVHSIKFPLERNAALYSHRDRSPLPPPLSFPAQHTQARRGNVSPS